MPVPGGTPGRRDHRPWPGLGRVTVRRMTLAPTGPVSLTHTVAAADSAVAWGSGTVAVLATPRLLALAEAATLRVLDGRLPPEQTTVGTRVELDHLAAVPVGGQVTVTAELVEADMAASRVMTPSRMSATRCWSKVCMP